MTVIEFSIESGDTEKSLADWGIDTCSLQRRNQEDDLLTFNLKGTSFDAADAFAEDAVVTVYRTVTVDELTPVKTQFFKGRVIQTPATASGSSESKGYVVAGPWRSLTDTIYQQIWSLADDPTKSDSSLVAKYRSHVILNIGATLDNPYSVIFWTAGMMIKEAVRFCNESATLNGLPEPVLFDDAILTDFNFGLPVSEESDISCAEVIKNQLRMTPDAIAWFDYSTDTPTLRIKRRSQLDKVDLTIGQVPENLTLTPRYDLRVPSVCLKYEQTFSQNDYSWVSITEDHAPNTTADENAKRERLPRAMVSTINLQGGSSTVVKSKISTSTPDASSTSDTARVNWWKNRIPWLKDKRITDITIDPKSVQSSGVQNLPHELIAGSIADWMGFKFEEVEYSATVSYRVLQEKDGEPLVDDVLQDKENEIITAKGILTDAPLVTNKVYSATQITQLAELPPIGLAAAIFDSFQKIQYEGEFTLREDDAGGYTVLGKVLNVVGSDKPEYETMDALVQEITEDILTGQTTVTVGPAKHLGPTDIIEYMRCMRQRRLYVPFNSRDVGKATGGGSVDISATNTPERSNNGAGGWKKLVLVNGETRIILDPSVAGQFPIDVKQFEFVPIFVNENGNKKRMLVLGSRTFEP